MNVYSRDYYTTVVNTVTYNQQYTGVYEEIKQKIDAVWDCNEISAKVRACKRKSGGKKHVNLNSCCSDSRISHL